MILIGFPTAILLDGISFVTTDDAPIVTLSPIVTHPSITTLSPIKTLFPIFIFPFTLSFLSVGAISASSIVSKP